MDVTPLVPAGRRIIESYGAGGFRISGVRHEGSLIVFPERVVRWRVSAWLETELQHVHATIREGPEPAPELLLLGTGERMLRLGVEARLALRASGIAVEAMDTGAACRTYNVLLAEGRRVAAALIAVA